MRGTKLHCNLQKYFQFSLSLSATFYLFYLFLFLWALFPRDFNRCRQRRLVNVVQPPQSLLEKRKKSSDRFMLLYIGVAFFAAVAVAVAAAMLLLPTLITTDQIAWRSGQVESYLCAGCRLSFAYIYATSLYIYIYIRIYTRHSFYGNNCIKCESW